MPPSIGSSGLEQWPRELWRRKVVVAAIALTCAVAAYAASHLVTPLYASRMSFLPPLASGSPLTGALASLGALTGLGGSAARNTGDQYVGFLRSQTIADKLVAKFDLRRVYNVRFQQDAREELAQRSAITLGKRDGIVTVEVTDADPQRAAAIVRTYLDELRQMTSQLVLSEAQQRRRFFEEQMSQTRARLGDAQRLLGATGFDASAVRVEPKATADAYSRLRADLALAEIRLQAMRRSFADDALEVQQEMSKIQRLRAEMLQVSRPSQAAASGSQPAGYVDAYREFKYQETLLQLVAQQFELARLDEGRESGQLQVIDLPQVPERRVWPQRGMFAAAGLVAGLLLGIVVALWLSTRTRTPAVAFGQARTS